MTKAELVIRWTKPLILTWFQHMHLSRLFASSEHFIIHSFLATVGSSIAGFWAVCSSHHFAFLKPNLVFPTRFFIVYLFSTFFAIHSWHMIGGVLQTTPHPLSLFALCHLIFWPECLGCRLCYVTMRGDHLARLCYVVCCSHHSLGCSSYCSL